jgi:ribosome-associated protein
MIFINSNVSVPLSEIHFSFARSGGPGGQNVNKVNTKAILKWSLWNTQSLNHEDQLRVNQNLPNDINSQGELVIISDESRSQLLNKEKCIEKFRDMLEKALFVPKVRKKTKVPREVRRNARVSKQKQSQKKKLRSSRFDD